MKPLSESSTRAFQALWQSDPLRAAHWVSQAAAHAHVETPALKKLDALLALEGTSRFDLGALKQLVAERPELSLPLGSLQAARETTLGWNAEPTLDPPNYTGTVRVKGDQVQLMTPMGTFDLAYGLTQWGSKWADAVGAFDGGVVTVRGWPDQTGAAIAVEAFAPGSSPSFVQGRVTRTEDGAVAIQERADKLVRITDPQLAARLGRFTRVAFIIPGEAVATPNAKGGLDWRLDGKPDGYYMLTKLNPGDDKLYDADTPFEKTHVQAAAGQFPVDKLGQRVFVFGSIADEHAGVVSDRVRKFTASWVSTPILPAWQRAAGERSQSLELHKDVEVAVAALDPRLKKLSPAGEFAPELDVVAAAHVLAEKWGQRNKNGIDLHQRPHNPGRANEWQIGSKTASGPIDAEGRKHGIWSEYVKDPTGAKQVAMKGQYEHGERHGVWVQFKDGAPANAWQFENGRLKAAGHVDEQLKPHGAWTLVGTDGLHDGGEGEYLHGVRVGDWWFYKPGTSDYERAEIYHPNGALAAEGKTEALQLGEEKFDLRVGEWRLFDEQGKLTGTVRHTLDEHIEGASGRQVSGGKDQ